MLINSNNQKGVSLVELMVGIVIALILLTGVLTVMLRVSTEGGNSVKATRLNQEMRSTLDFMAKELQRAGYYNWFELADVDNDGSLGTDLGDDVYTGDVGTYTGVQFYNILDLFAATDHGRNLFGDVGLYTAMTTTACSTDCTCILYSYDLNKDGLQGIGSLSTGTGQNTTNIERFGFRFNSSDNEVEMMNGGVHACNGTGWVALTDNDIVKITDLSFEMEYADIDTSTATDIYTSTIYSISGIDADDFLYTMDGVTSCTPSVSGDFPGSDSTADTVCQLRRKVAITLEGELAEDSGVKVKLETNVKLKNDFLDTEN